MTKKTPISVRISEDDLRLIDQGATASHMDRTSFLIEAGVHAASKAILDRMDANVFLLPEEALAVLDKESQDPQAPSPALLAAADRHKARKTERERY